MKPRKESKLSDRIPVVALIRVSTEEQAKEDKGGIPAQKDACEQIALRHNLEIRWHVQIEDVSGAHVLHSPKMKEVIRIVSSGQCRGIVIREASRLMRPENFEDYALLQVLSRHAIKIYLIDGVLDLTNASDKLFSHVKFAFAGYERNLIRDRMLSGKLAKRRRGQWVSGANAVPYGLKVEQERHGKIVINWLRVDDSSIHRVQHLFQAFIGGNLSFSSLHRETGIPYDAVPYILANEIYTGYHVPRKTADPEANVYREDGSLRYQKRVIIPEDQRERIKMLDKPPISPEVFAQAQRLLQLKREMRIKRTRETPDAYVYRGFLRCAECDMRLTTVKYFNKQANFAADYYVCRAAHGSRGVDGQWKIKNGSCKTRRIRREVLEPVLDEIVVRRFANPRFLSDLIQAHAAAEKQVSTAESMKRLRMEIQETGRAIERNQEMYMRGKITRPIFDRNDHKLQLEKRASESELAKLQPDRPQMNPETWAPIARQFQRWHKLEAQQKRKLLSAIAPIFVVAGYAGEKYHETVVKVKGCHVNLTGEHFSTDHDEAAGENGSEGKESKAGKALVAIGSLTNSAHDVNQSSIYIPF